MRIKTQFILTILLFGTLIAGITVSAIFTNRQVANANIQESLAHDVSLGASELSYLANDYIVYRENQQIERWQLKFDEFSQDVARLDGNTLEERSLIGNIQTNRQRLKEIFDSIVASAGTSGQTEPFNLEFLQIARSRINVQSQALITDASRLSRLDSDQVGRLRENNLLVIFALVAMFGAYFVANYFLIQKRTLATISTLLAGTAVIGSGNLDFRIEEKKHNEIGDLSHAINLMTSRLKEVTSSKSDLEREVEHRKSAEEKLAHLASFPALNPNPVLELDGECRLTYVNDAARASIPDIEKLGSEHPYLAGCKEMLHDMQHGEKSSSREIQIGNDWHWQAIAYVPETNSLRIYGRDITERVEAEKALQQSEARYRELFTSMTEGFAFHEIIVDEAGKPVDYRFVEVNPAFEHMTGLKAADIIGKTVLDVLPGTESHWIEAYGKVALSGRPTTFSSLSSALDKWYEVLAYSPRPGYFATIFTDITERKAAEEELRETRDYLDSLFDYANAPIIVWNPEFKITRFNHAFEHLTGRTSGEVMGKHLEMLFPAESREASMALIRKTAVGEKWEVVEIPILHRSGRVRIVLWNSAAIYAPGSKSVIATIAQGQEITERKDAEEELLRVNRELRAISECDQALVRAKNETELLTDVCRIICDVAGYSMAWVGMVQHDAAKSIKPVAWGGAESGYLKEAKISWGNNERGRGASGQAVRTGKTHFFQDFINDPAAAPWREAAVQRGYRSSISIPLFNIRGDVFGVFSLYAAQANSFNPAEVKLLEELAGDLAFGINTLHERVIRQQAEDASAQKRRKTAHAH